MINQTSHMPARTRRAHLLLAWLLLLWVPASAQGQLNRGFGARASQDLIVLVEVLVNNGIDAPDFAPGSGIVVGMREDTLLLLTAFHLLRPPHATVDSISVQLYPNGPRLTAIQAERDTALDLAVLKAHLPGGAGTVYPGGPPRPLEGPEVSTFGRPGTPLFATGCPRGECWGQPEEARVYLLTDSLIEFRGSGIENGFSGGALLDRYGAIIGMIIHDDPPHTAALRWDVATKKFTEWGYVQNLPLRSIERSNEFGYGLSLQGFPLPVKNEDGSFVGPSALVSVTYRATNRLDLVAGFATASFPLSSEPDTLLAAAGNFFLLGLRVNFAQNQSLLGGRYPDVAYLGGSYRFNALSQILYRGVIPDSFDLRSGEPVRETRVKGVAVQGFGGSAGVRLYTPGDLAVEIQLSADVYRSADFPLTVTGHGSVGLALYMGSTEPEKGARGSSRRRRGRFR